MAILDIKRFRRSIMVVSFLALIIVGFNSALSIENDAVSDSGICGENLNWQYSNGKLTISGIGDMYDFKYNTSPWYKYRYNTSELIIQPGVTSIGDNAFHLCASTKIVIPDSVKSIGTQAFYSSTVETLIIGSGLETLGEDAFRYCSQLTYLEYNANLKEIPKNAFGSAGSSGDGFKLAIGDNVTSIPDSLFRGTSTTEIVIGKAVRDIGYAAFYGCDMTKKITFNGHALENIGEIAFDLKGNSHYAVSCEVMSSYDEGFLDASSRGNVSFTYTKVMPTETHTVRFVTNCPTSLEPMTVYDGFPVNPEVSYYGYFLEGWYLDSKFSKSFDILGPVNSDLTLYAHWIPADKFTVTFETNGGSSMDPVTEYAGVKLSDIVKDPTRGNFIFEGWYVDKQLHMPIKEGQLLTGDITLYAGWSQPSDANTVYLAIAIVLAVVLLALIHTAVNRSKDPDQTYGRYAGLFGLISLAIIALIAAKQYIDGVYIIDIGAGAAFLFLPMMFITVFCPMFLRTPGMILGMLLSVIVSIIFLQEAVKTDELLDYLKIAWPIVGMSAVYGNWRSWTCAPDGGPTGPGGGSGSGCSSVREEMYPEHLMTFQEKQCLDQ